MLCTGNIFSCLKNLLRHVHIGTDALDISLVTM